MSAANVAQLAVDLLITSLSLRSIGLFDSRDLVPVVGGREDGEEGVSTPLEREFRLHSFLLLDYSDKRIEISLQCSEEKGATSWSFNSDHPSCSYVVSQLTRVAFRAVPLTRVSSPVEKARVYRHTLPVYPGIEAFCDPLFVRRRHV